MPRQEQESTIIKPREVRLGGTPETKSKLQTGYIWVAIGVLLTAFVLVSLMFLTPPEPTPVAVEQMPPQSPTTTQSTAPQAPTPMQVERERQARETARDLVKRFTELELELQDEWKIQNWGGDDLTEAREIVLAAEQDFADAQFEQALAGYTSGVARLEEMRSDARDAYNQALKRALDALAARDGASAEAALREAARYQPQGAIIEAGRKRLAQLDELSKLIADAERAESEGELARAIDLAEQARKLDAATQGIDQMLRRLRQARLDRRFRDTLAKGYAALDEQDYSAAQGLFEAALSMKPNNPAAEQGLEQARTDSANTRIQSGLAEAQALADTEDWDAAISAFNKVRQIDASLREANEGLAQAQARKMLDAALSDMIGAPGRLADDEKLAQAKALLARATQVQVRGERIDQQQRRLDQQIRYASEPASVTLLSDGLTDVRLQYKGDLGKFTSRTLKLRPGDYLVRGGRDGYRDVRFVAQVVAGRQQIEVICVEPIE